VAQAAVALSSGVPSVVERVDVMRAVDETSVEDGVIAATVQGAAGGEPGAVSRLGLPV